LLRQESHQRSGLRGGADRDAYRTSSVVGTLLPRLQAALPLRILSRPPTGIGWWSEFLGFLPSADFFCSAKRTNRRGGAVRRPWLPSFSDLRAARRTAPTGCSSIYTVGAVINRPHWRMTCASDKNGMLYRRAMDNCPYSETLLPGANIIPYPLSFIHYRTAYASGG